MEARDDQLFALAVALPFLGALFTPSLTRLMGRWAALALCVFPVIGLGLIGQTGALVQAGDVGRASLNWIPSFDVRLSFRLDGLSLVFSTLVLGIGALILVYSGGYLPRTAARGRFFMFLFLFMGAMLGLVLADDLITLFIFWEATSIASFLLIGFDHEREAARRAAIQALVITGGGGLAMLAGFILIRQVTGLSSLSQILAAPGAIAASGAAMPILVLLLLGAFTKSAQMPFHVWLPNAMEAPTPVSAYLHSATMVKAGVYLLMRFFPVFGQTPAWQIVLPTVGAVTLVVGALLSIRQSDVKLMLAYTTIASLGLLVMMLGVGSPLALKAAVLYFVAHSLAKACLFMVAGSIDHGAGTRDVRALGGLWRTMPFTFAAALFGAAAMAGLPPLFGFLAKEEIYAALADLGSPLSAVPLTLAALIGNGVMVAAILVVALRPFVGTLPGGLRKAHETGFLVWTGPLILGVAGIVAGLFSQATHRLVSSPAYAALDPDGGPITIAVGFHLGMPLALSVATLALAVLIYRRSAQVRQRVAGVLSAIGWGPDRGFDQFMRGLIAAAFRLTNLIQPGRLDYYMRVTFMVIIGALWISMIRLGTLPEWPSFPRLFFYEWAVLGIIVLGLAVVASARSRLAAIVSLGIQGLAVALLFMLLGAPDLSFTQFMVEILTVAILALVMTRLRLMPTDHRPWREVVPELAIAIAGGLGFALFLITVSQIPLDTSVSDFFNRYAYVIAHGRNVVNVILVDFRAVDTMGEIAVVLTTGAAILALVRIRVSRKDRAENRRRRRPAEGGGL